VATILQNFTKWKDFLGDRVEQAEKAGMSEETMANLAVQIGEFLSDKVDPENKEERVLKDLWDVADDSEKKIIAKLMIKLSKSSS
jgi:hypothetical protein